MFHILILLGKGEKTVKKILKSLKNGGWSGWTAWSGCAAGICAGNQRIRTRTCTIPIPTEDGKYCDGDSAQQLDCLSEYCYFKTHF